ncbi:MAG TPA: biotin/lipoyl-binding protein, partial [Thermomicrobiales bacterium]|nr:biotin/lipoyl-binding protein [Thermomicrobiales bacterium]
MNRLRLLIALLIGIVVVAAAAWYLTGRGEDQQTAVAERGSLDVTIQTVGTLQATGATTVRSIQSGIVETVGVRAGDVVEEGDIIALLEMEPFDRNVQQAQREFDQAEFALQAAEQQA